jgi:alpha-galactosidase
MGPWELGKGSLGDPKKTPISVGGKSYPKALGMHPDSLVKYKLAKTAKAFKAAVTIDDSNIGNRTGDVGFDVYGDGKLLWSSKAINGKDTRDECAVSVAGVDVLELRTRLRQGSGWGAHAVWLDPYVIK